MRKGKSDRLKGIFGVEPDPFFCSFFTFCLMTFAFVGCITPILINGNLSIAVPGTNFSFFISLGTYQKEPKNNLLCRQLNRMISQGKRR